MCIRDSVGVVRQRLTHPHQHDVAQTAPAVVESETCCPHDLLGDLAARELPEVAGLTRRAETTRHGAPRLARHAHRHAVAVAHEDRFDASPVAGSQQPLEREAAIADRLVSERERRRERRDGRQLRPQRPWQLAQLVRRLSLIHI